MRKRFLRLTLWSGFNFTGRRIDIRRGGVAIRDLDAFRFDNVLSSFRSVNTANRFNVTLVLFSRRNFQGSVRVFPGNTVVSNLGNFNNLTSSLIFIGRPLSAAEIAFIQSTGRLPRGIVVIDD